jgi:PAS domain S-box-containing protein
MNFKPSKKPVGISSRAAAISLALVALLCCKSRAADNPPLEELHTAAQVRRLTPEQAALHYPVHLHGVITAFDQSKFARAIQDDTAGIYIGDSGNLPPLKPGDIVEIQGVTFPGEYAPILQPSQIQTWGTGALPDANPTTFEMLASGKEDSQFVEVNGIVRSTHVDEQKHQYIDIVTGGGRLTACFSDLPAERLQELVDSTVQVRGVCLTSFNRQRQLFSLWLMAPNAEDLVVLQPALKDPFALRTEKIGSLEQFAPEGTFGHRVKVAGTVIYRQAGELYIQDDNEGLHVQTQQGGALLAGDRIEVVGFPAKGDYTPKMEDAIYRRISAGPVPAPVSVTVDEALRGNYDSRLVRVEATLLDRARQTHGQFVVLQSAGLIFDASIEGKDGGTGFSYLQNGSKVSVTGICLIDPGNNWYGGNDWRAKSFHILMRSAGDVSVLKYPPWWTLQKMLWMVGALGLVVLAAFAWVVVLRRRVHVQTDIIRQKLQVEATLKERYVELFEHANDMVYTHDSRGRITSINETGERLLQRPRKEILGRKIVELVVPEQQAAAQEWLEQVLKGTAPPTAEWDFTTASDHRLKMEISTRLIEQDGRLMEVEGIARDITERKRLEREILEISNREQRRIGHDLHDGICQLLAGISFMSESLADVLEESGSDKASEAERISVLINTAITQTRGVARGLFPVRLEENGLASALEELAAGARELFKVNCQFRSQDPPTNVANEIALHLYYIALEAVSNAAKHGKAKNITITLEPVGNRYALSVEDDGTGFSPPDCAQTGMGIRIMHYRARVIGATLSLESRPGYGTHLTCLFFPDSQELTQNAENNGNENREPHGSGKPAYASNPD